MSATGIAHRKSRRAVAGRKAGRIGGQRRKVHRATAAAASSTPTVPTDLISVIAELRAQVRGRNTLLHFEVAFGNMVKAVKRQLERAPESLPADFAAKDFVEQEKALRKRRQAAEKIIVELVKKLPVHDWWISHRGLGPMGLGQVIGITGDLSNFRNPAKVWKFLSLHVIDGKAARRARGAAGVAQGFSPFRRTIMHQIGDAIMKLNRGGIYRKLYEDRKTYDLSKIPLHTRGRKGWAHKRALRYVEKRILRDLWRRWRDATKTA